MALGLATPASLWASLEATRSPGPTVALALPTGGLLLIDAFTLVNLAGKYAGRSAPPALLHN